VKQNTTMVYTSSDKENYITILGERKEVLKGFKELMKEYTNKYEVGLNVFATELAEILSDLEIERGRVMIQQLSKEILRLIPKEELSELSENDKELLRREGLGEFIDD